MGDVHEAPRPRIAAAQLAQYIGRPVCFVGRVEKVRAQSFSPGGSREAPLPHSPPLRPCPGPAAASLRAEARPPAAFRPLLSAGRRLFCRFTRRENLSFCRTEKAATRRWS